jgi:hypothetical protein
VEFFKYGTVGRALGNRCLYPEPDEKNYAVFRKGRALSVSGPLVIPMHYTTNEQDVKVLYELFQGTNAL